MSNAQLIRTIDGETVSEARIEEYETKLRWALIRPNDDDYDEARSVWNGMIDRHPALITRPVDVEDVVASINFTRENNILLAVRGGGHNVAGLGTSDGGLVIDLSEMNDVQVDPEARTARVGGGATIGDVDQATQTRCLIQ